MKGDKSDTGWSKHNPPDGHDYSPPPASAAAYIPPTEAPKESKYHTLDLKAVRLSPDIDPQRMKTQMSLRRLPVARATSATTSVWMSLCLAGAALGLGAWWCLQWWREQGSPVDDERTRTPIGLAASSAPPVPRILDAPSLTLPSLAPSGLRLVSPPREPAGPTLK